MTESDRSDTPDVEKIVADIRRTVEDAGAWVDEPPEEDRGPGAAGQKEEDVLYTALEALNSHWKVGEGGGPIERLQLGNLTALIGELNRYHSRVVQVLNRIVALLDGTDDGVSSEFLESNRQRIDLLQLLADRMAEYDRQDLDARLCRLEDRLSGPGE